MQKVMPSLRWGLLWLILAMGSMDVFGVFHVKGFTVRLVLFFVAAFVLWEGVRLTREKKWNFSSWWFWLVAIALFNTFFSLVSPSLFRGLGYAVWLWLFVGWVTVFAQMAKEENIFSKMVMVYVTSFIPAMVVGWLQWVVPSLAWSDSFLWKTQGVLGITNYHGLHRVNGWNYEPSYFATYLLPIFPLLMGLFSHQKGLARISLGAFFLFAGLILFLTTSRMGWLAGIMFCAGAAGIWGTKKLFQGRVEQLKRYVWIGGLLVGVAMVLFVKVFPSFRNILLKVMKWSFLERLEAMQNTLEVFFTHPWWGVGLGGVAGAIAQIQQGMIPQGGEVKAFEGMCVLFEYMAAFGVWGMLLLGGLGGSILITLRRFWKNLSSFEKSIGLALFSGLGLQMFLLLFNQNILRVYVWNHIAMVGAFLATMESQGGKNCLRENKQPVFELYPWFVSFLVAIVGVSLLIMGYVFQPIKVKIHGLAFQWEFSQELKPKEARLFYIISDKGGFSSQVSAMDKRITFSFTNYYSISKTFFTKAEISQLYPLWKDIAQYGKKKYWFMDRFLEVEKHLREIMPDYDKSPENLYQAINYLLAKDEVFLGWTKMYSLSDLTQSYLKKKSKTPLDKIRFHRLILEDVLPIVPFNLEEYQMRYYLLEIQGLFNNQTNDSKKVFNVLESNLLTNIRWHTSLGEIDTPVKILPARFWKNEDKIVLHWEFSPLYWKIQAIRYRKPFTILVVMVFALTWAGIWAWLSKLKRRG